MFVFELGNATLRVTVDDTRRVRLISVVLGLVELAPDEVASKFYEAARYMTDVDLCTAGQFRRIVREALGPTAMDSVPCRAFFEVLFAGLVAATGGVFARLVDLIVATTLLLSGTRKSEKLAFAFEALAGETGGDLDESERVRLFSGVLCAVLAVSGEFTASDGVSVSRVALRTAADLSAHVVAGNSPENDFLSFDAFGAWYNSQGFELAPWLELLDLSKWPNNANDDAGLTEDDESSSGDEEEEDEEDYYARSQEEEETSVVAFDVATEEEESGHPFFSRPGLLSASFSPGGVSRLRDLVVNSGLGDCDASVLCGALKRNSTDSGRLELVAFADMAETLCGFDLTGSNASAALLRFLHAAFSTRDERLGADYAEFGAGLSLLCAGSKSAKLAVAWEVLAEATCAGTSKLLTRRGLWRYFRAFLLPLIALSQLPDDNSGTSKKSLTQIVDDVDNAAVTLAATVFAEMQCGDSINFDDFADWYTEGGFKTASWLELLALDKWVL